MKLGTNRQGLCSKGSTYLSDLTRLLEAGLTCKGPLAGIRALEYGEGLTTLSNKSQSLCLNCTNNVIYTEHLLSF